jgi:hypothetical protein
VVAESAGEQGHTYHHLPFIPEVKEVVMVTMEVLLKVAMALFTSRSRDMAEVSMLRGKSLDKLVAIRILVLIEHLHLS